MHGCTTRTVVGELFCTVHYSLHAVVGVCTACIRNEFHMRLVFERAELSSRRLRLAIVQESLRCVTGVIGRGSQMELTLGHPPPTGHSFPDTA